MNNTFDIFFRGLKTGGVLFILICSCQTHYNDEFNGLEHIEGQDKHEIHIRIDTIQIDASATSLRGTWDIRYDRLFYTDFTLVGVREFDKDGNYIGKHIKSGRGPDEMSAKAVASCFDYKNDNLAIIDEAWQFSIFNPEFKKIAGPFAMLSDINYTGANWQHLLSRPDPEDMHMYEFNLDSRAIVCVDNIITIPIVTEHITFNAYSKIANSKRFWKESYIFMSVDPVEKKTRRIFGHYPAVYQKKQIPAFYKYSFDTDGKYLYTTFAADPLIYVRDLDGEPKFTFGTGVEGIDDNYVETKSFEEYNEKLDGILREYGYYQGIKCINGLIFRSYKLPRDNGYGIQIYQNYNMVGDLHFDEPVSVFGRIEDAYYAIGPTDIDNDLFTIYRIYLDL